MKRPLLFASVIFLFSTALLLWEGGLSGLSGVGVVLLFCVLAKSRREATGILLAGGLAAALALGAVWGLECRLESLRPLEGTSVSYVGWVEEKNPYSPGRVRIRGNLGEAGDGPGVLLDVLNAGRELNPGEWVAGKAQVLEVRADGDALFTGGVSLLTAAEGEAEPVPTPEGFHVLAELTALRWELSQEVYAEAPGDASGVAAAMVFSRGDLLEQELLDRIGQAGIRHLLVVSGLHLSILVGWIGGACRVLKLGRFPQAVFCLMGVWFMAAMAGFSVSVLRSGVMTSMWLLGSLLGRRSDGLTSLGLAGLLLGCICPPVVWETGAQLTFAATLGLLLGSGPVSRWLLAGWESRFGAPGKLTRWILEGVSASFCAQLGTLPVLAASFGYLTTWGLLTNLLVMPFVTGVVLLGGLGAALLPFSWGETAGGFLLGGARLLARLILEAVDLVCLLPFGTVPVLLPYQLALCCMGTVGIFGYLILRPRMSPGTARTIRRCGAGFLAAALMYSGFYYRDATLVSADGDTGAVVISAPGGTLVLDGGQEDYQRRMLSQQLLRCGAGTPEAVVRPEDSGVNATLWMAQEFSPSVVLVPEEQLPLLEGQLPTEFRALEEGPVEVLPGVVVSHPAPEITCVETAGRKVLKCWAGYGIIKESYLPPDADIIIDMDGRMYAPGLEPGRMPGEITNLLLTGPESRRG